MLLKDDAGAEESRGIISPAVIADVNVLTQGMRISGSLLEKDIRGHSLYLTKTCIGK